MLGKHLVHDAAVAASARRRNRIVAWEGRLRTTNLPVVPQVVALAVHPLHPRLRSRLGDREPLRVDAEEDHQREAQGVEGGLAEPVGQACADFSLII